MASSSSSSTRWLDAFKRPDEITKEIQRVNGEINQVIEEAKGLDITPDQVEEELTFAQMRKLNEEMKRTEGKLPGDVPFLQRIQELVAPHEKSAGK